MMLWAAAVLSALGSFCLGLSLNGANDTDTRWIDLELGVVFLIAAMWFVVLAQYVGR